MSNKQYPAIISVHDVMPETLMRVNQLLNTVLAHIAPTHILLLVVPGLHWQAEQLKQLKALQVKGYELAGHGWFHEVNRIATPWHKLHSLFLSRRAAEHLSQSEENLIALLQNNYRWFEQNGLAAPKMYVPPAWAMGRLSDGALKTLPFECYEDFSGFYWPQSGQRKRLPLIGFEADTRLRASVLRLWNAFNFNRATRKSPVRISIHPYDLDFYLARQLTTMVLKCSSRHWRDVADDVFVRKPVL